MIMSLKIFFVLSLALLNDENVLGQRTTTPRPDMQIRLRGGIQPVLQQHPYYCALAVAEAILRYAGLNPNVLPMGIQASLSFTMRTDLSSGTAPENWIGRMNFMLSRYNLGGGRQYSMTRFPEQRTDTTFYNRFYHLVRASLALNMPPALFFQGNTPEFFDDETDDPIIRSRHVVLITGVDYTRVPGRSPRITYHYMEPWTGNFRSFTEAELRLVLMSGRDANGHDDTEGYLMSYIPPPGLSDNDRANGYDDRFDPEINQLAQAFMAMELAHCAYQYIMRPCK